MKQTLHATVALPLLFLALFATRADAQCPQVEAIMINACGPESFNEFIIIHSGGGFNTADIQLDYDVSNNILGPANNDINTNVDNWPANPAPCGLATGNIGAYTGCPNLIAVGSGVNIPANAIVVLQTSGGATANLYNFAALCGAGECVYVISSSCARSAGAFSNQGAGSRTTNFSIAGGCTQSITYDLSALSDTNGDYYLPLSGAYGNAGCTVPPTSPAPLPPMINPIANVNVCGSYTLPAIAGTNLTANAAYFTGPNGSGTEYNAGDVITATTTLYAFDSNGPGCSDQEQFTVTISPAPTVNLPNNATPCAGQNVNIPITGTPGATFPWTNDNTAIGLAASGTGAIVFTAANVSSQQVATITITPTLGGCPGAPVSFTITVNPAPAVNDPANQSVCAGQTVTTTFSSPSGNPIYNWTNSNPGIGLPASGAGNISFAAANVSNPTTATITVTPSENGCTGTAQTFTITVNPAATVNQPASPVVCAGQQVAVNFAGSSGATFAWTNSNTAIGLGASGSGNINFTAAGVSAQEVGTITVTPTSPAGCPGTPVSFTVTVNPGPAMNVPANVAECANSPVSVVFTSPAGSPTYAWTNSNTAIGLGTAGSGNLNFTTANVTTPTTATITVTPSLGGCVGAPVSFTITVNPGPVMNDPANQSVCAGDAVTVTFSSPSGNPTYAWTNSNTAIGLDAAGAGNISFTAAAVPNPITGTITVTPSENGCTGTAQTFTITVNPDPVVNQPGNVNACTGQFVGITFTGTPGTTYTWTNNNTAIGLGASGSGNISFPAASVQSPETATITATPTLGSCMGAPVTFTITINPGPVVDDPANQSVCGNDPVSVTFTSPAGNPNFNWTNNNPGIGLPASGSGNINFTAANPATVQTATISVIPSENGCTGMAQTFTITVNPLPTVTQPANISACSGQIVVTNLSGTPASAMFSWTNNNPAIGLPASGSGNISFTAENVQNQEIATITITPELGPCIGTPVTFTITVTPAPTMNPVPDESVCGGALVNVVFTSPSGNPTYNWTNSNPAIGLPATGSGNLNFTAANAPTTQTATITVTPAQNGCTGAPQTFTIEVSPVPAVVQPANAATCGGGTVSVNFNGSPGASFDWINNNPAIGLPASGSGNISFTAANPATQQVATITVTPVIGGCTGTPRTFTITVNPAPIVNPPGNQAVCGGDVVNVVFSSPNSSPTYSWTNDNTAIGLDAAGIGNIGFTSAIVATAQTANITVTPSANGCTGQPETFTIIVSPTPTVNQPGNLTLCGGQSVVITLSGSPGATFNWTNSNPATGLPATGSGGSIPINTANVGAQQVGTITITPTVGSCTGVPVAFTLTVNPAPGMDDPANRTVCAGEVVSVNFTGAGAASFSWTNSNTAVGLPASGTGNIGFLAANVAATQTATVTVTPMLGSCSGTPQTFTIVVNPAPAADPIANRNACSGDSVLVNFAGSPGATFSWTNDNPAIGLPAGGSGNLDFIAAQITGNETATITVIPEAGGGACPGVPVIFTITVKPVSSVTNPGDRIACAGELVEVPFSTIGNPTVFWTNSNPAIGLPASGTGDLSFFAANVGATETATITVSQPGGFAYIANYLSSDVSVIDLATNTVIATIPVGFGAYGVSVSPDGTRVYVTNEADGTVSVLDGVTNTLITTVGVGATPTGIAVSPDGTRVFVANSGSNSISVLDAATNTVLATIPAGTSPRGITWQPDGSRVYATGSNPSVLVTIDAATNTILSSVPTGDTPAGVRVSPNGARIYVANSFSNNLYVFNAANNAIIAIIPTDNFPNGVAVSPDGSRVYVTNENASSVTVINAATFATSTIAVSSGPLSGPIGISITPNGQYLYVANILTEEVSVIDLATNTEVALIPVGASPISFGNFITPVTPCVAPPQTFTITVNPAPAVDQPADVSVCSGEVVAVNFTGSAGATFSWTNDNPNIGLPAIGSGNINFDAAQVAGNETATITVTPDAGGVGACSGAPVTFEITVQPGISVDDPGDRFACVGDLVEVLFSATGNPTVSWINDNPAIGLPASGTGDISFIAANVAGVETATITVAAQAKGEYAYIVNNALPGTVSVIEIETNTVIDTIPVGNGAFGVSVSPDGSKVYVTCQGTSNSVYVIDVATNSVIAIIPVGARPTGITTSPDGSIVYTANNVAQTVSVIDAQTNSLIIEIPIAGGTPNGIATSPDGNWIYVTTTASAGQSTVSVIDANTNTITTTILVGDDPRGIVVSPNGNRIYTANIGFLSYNISVIDASNNTVIATIPAGDAPHGLAISPDGNRLYATNENSGDVTVIDAVSNTVVATIPTGSVGPIGVSITPDGSLLYVAQLFGDVAVINTGTNTVTTTIPIGGSPLSFGNFITTAATCIAPPQTFTITVGPAPTLAQPNNAAVCGNTAATLAFSASPGATVNWTNDNPGIGLPASGTGSLVFTAAGVATPQTATITATPVLGSCSGTPVTFTVTVNPAAVGSISGDLLLCAGDSTTLTATGGATYAWDNGATTASITVGPAVPTTFVAVITTSAGCATAASVFVNINPAPVATISGDTTLCGAETTTLTASGGNIYLWNNGETNATITVGPASAGTYTVNATNTFGCTATAEATVTANPVDETAIAQTTCNPADTGTVVQVLQNLFGCDSTVTTTTTLLPSNSLAITQLTCDPSAAGVFTENLLNQFGCDSIVTTTVVFDPTVIDTIELFATTCDPAQAGISVQNLTNQFGCDSIVTTTTTLLPSDAVNLAATTCDPAQAGISVQNLTNQFGCDSIVTTTTTLLPSDAVSIAATTCDPAQVGVLVQNLTNQFGCDSIVTTTTTLLPSNAVSIAATTCDPAEVGISVQNLTNQFGCDSIVTTTTVLDLAACGPVVMVSAVGPNCAGNATGSFTIQIQSGQPPLQYNWTNNLGNTGTGQIIALTPPTVVGNLPAGTYSITITDSSNGATTTATATLTAPPILSATATAPAPHSGFEVRCAGGSDGGATAAAAGGTPPYLFAWNTGAATATLSNLAAGAYTVLATDANGCTASASVALNAPPRLPLIWNSTVPTAATPWWTPPSPPRAAWRRTSCR
ncbi:MAG: beta-propeller fold lactonase family protein [Lewinellaceae bacterium]|nr:beta-propeller fold lactonase family protein [Lewinellaceae bacterium]